MKKCLLISFLMFTTQSWALSINITSPANGTVFPATQSSVTINGTVSEAPSGTGSVVCTGNKIANFSTQTSTNWFRGWPLANGLNTVTCVYTKGSQTASATVSFTRESSPPANSAPHATLGATPLTGPAPHNVAFASGSYDSDGTIASYLWTYGDGTTSTTNANHYKLYTQPGTYTAVLKVTDNNGATDEATKTITVTAPTNPNSTLLGPDSDNDGVRDDVQTWIDTTYSNQTNVKIAAKKYAQAYQNTFINKDNKANSIVATKSLLKAGNCLLATLKENGMTARQSIREKDKLKLLHTNTKERITAQLKINENFDGSSYKILSKNEACNQ